MAAGAPTSQDKVGLRVVRAPVAAWVRFWDEDGVAWLRKTMDASCDDIGKGIGRTARALLAGVLAILMLLLIRALGLESDSLTIATIVGAAAGAFTLPSLRRRKPPGDPAPSLTGPPASPTPLPGPD